MAELVRVKCTGGDLIVTEKEITIELKKLFSNTILKRQSIARAAITGKDEKTHATNGFVDFTFRGAGTELVAKLVKPAEAQRVRAALAEQV
jgi:hypothetical protein